MFRLAAESATKKKVNPPYLNTMCFPVSMTEVNSLQYISTNAVIFVVKVTNTTFLTYSAVAAILIFLSFPPDPSEMCPVLGQDCADRPVLGCVPAPILSLLLRSPQLC